MAVINYSKKEISAKIVYYGPSLCGKTTNIQSIYTSIKPEQKGKLVSLATEADRTLFFDFLPIEIANIRGFKTRLHFYTVPGQVYYNSTRRAVLTGVDGIVFVADSQRDKMEENVESLNNLEENLNYYGKSIKTLPMVFQYNKRDLPDVSSVAELEQILNPYGYPFFEAVATTGEGVLETLTRITKLVLQHIEMGTSGKQQWPSSVPFGTAPRGIPEPPDVFQQRPAPAGPGPVEPPRPRDLAGPEPFEPGRAFQAEKPSRPLALGPEDGSIAARTTQETSAAVRPVGQATPSDLLSEAGPSATYGELAEPAGVERSGYPRETGGLEPGLAAKPLETFQDDTARVMEQALGRIQIVGTENAEILSANALCIPIKVKIEGDQKVYRLDLAIKIDGLKP